MAECSHRFAVTGMLMGAVTGLPAYDGELERPHRLPEQLEPDPGQ